MRRSLSAAPVTLLAALLLTHCSSSASPASAGGSGSGSLGLKTGASCGATGPGLTDCGSDGARSCCSAAQVPGGDFFRSYDGISTNGATKDFPATVSAVAVDEYEVTVGRFRAFATAEVAGWRPATGSGKHSHLNGGKGLNGGTEPGWDASWSADLAATSGEWATRLACDAKFATWTGSAGAHEDFPINCIDWYEAYAFCIWDGGFLPSEAEWNFTASGGDEQRVYPWSAAYPPGSTTLDCSHADYSASWPSTSCVPSGTTKVGSFSPLGDGKWGHADLGGNVFEWTFDGYGQTYPAKCDDCADLTSTSNRVIRGGAFDGSPACLLNSLREASVPAGRSRDVGVRCARPPG